jgi:glycosyltransferase involved in cell wall biosynthesis
MGETVLVNIMVFDVPAEFGGALSILSELYNEVIEYPDKTVNWIFVLSKPDFNETDNIKVLRFPWVKKSWFHRLFFDNLYAPRLIKKYNVDKVLSLQNMVIPKTKVPQTLYVHQSLPFVDYKFNFRQNRTLWIYQNVIGKIITRSIKKAEKVIVQTQWMKKACIANANVRIDKFCVIPPQVKIMDNNNSFEVGKETLSTFFYPAGNGTYKNHIVILKACKILKEKNINNYKVILTLTGNEDEFISSIYREINELRLPIEFVGVLPREQVFNYYNKSVVLFPSYIETFGLPLLEAKLQSGIILASDTIFAKEVLDNYENAYYFNPFNEFDLAEYMESFIGGKVEYKHVRDSLLNYSSRKEPSIIDVVTGVL